jgi:hypothetical protein
MTETVTAYPTRWGAVGKGPLQSGTSLAAYPMPSRRAEEERFLRFMRARLA